MKVRLQHPSFSPVLDGLAIPSAQNPMTNTFKVLDPQSALLSNAEVWDFLNNNPPRKADKKSGAYEPVNLKDYHNVRKDVRELQSTSRT
jgi:hypothetical protein